MAARDGRKYQISSMSEERCLADWTSNAQRYRHRHNRVRRVDFAIVNLCGGSRPLVRRKNMNFAAISDERSQEAEY